MTHCRHEIRRRPGYGEYSSSYFQDLPRADGMIHGTPADAALAKRADWRDATDMAQLCSRIHSASVKPTGPGFGLERPNVD
ncbi:hypothetical protein GCM10009784_03510 [Arthrobacter parietis]|uniref:Uncharacterized protein n=1 Tax=Arthrobacter parietis TaxID=271434 RepID=A0ABN3AMX5_9MICC